MPVAADQIVRLGLAPLLLAQGLWVRSRARKLPEPDGPRSGSTGQGAPLRLLVIGDSSAAGVGTDHQLKALGYQLANALGQNCRVSWQLVAATGETTRSMLKRLAERPVSAADVAVVVLGVNDTTRFSSARSYRKRQTQIATRLQKYGARRIVFSGLPPMHHFPLLPQPLRWVLGEHAARLDSVLSEMASERADWSHLPLDLPYEPKYVAEDGFHPSAEAYAHWADMLAGHIYRKTGLPNLTKG